MRALLSCASSLEVRDRRRGTAVIIQGMWVNGTELKQKYISDARQKGLPNYLFFFLFAKIAFQLSL
jgi:hypothetical protein